MLLAGVLALHDGPPHEERERSNDEQRDAGADGEQREAAHGRAFRGSTIAPSARIEGTQSPTKIPCSWSLKNHRETDSTNEMPAARKSSDRAAVSCEMAPISNDCEERCGSAESLMRIPFGSHLGAMSRFCPENVPCRPPCVKLL